MGGGFWERQVSSIKNCLKKSLHFQKLDRVELETTLHEIEAIINSRPLTYISNDIRDPNPLTPSHFLINKTFGSKIENVIEDFHVSAKDLQLNYSIRQSCISQFWRTWSDEYLKNLPCVITKALHPKQIKVGDLVLIRNENKAKIFWPMGIITQTFLSEDGACRSVIIKTQNGLIKRSVDNLHQLECSHVRGEGSSGDTSTIRSNAQIGQLNETLVHNESEFDVSNESPNISEDCQAYEFQDDIEFMHWQDTQQGCHNPETTTEYGGQSQDTQHGFHNPETTPESGGQLQDNVQGCHNPESSSRQDLPRFTRRGRLIKPPNKLNL